LRVERIDEAVAVLQNSGCRLLTEEEVYEL